MIENKKRSIVTIILVVLVLGNIFFSANYYYTYRQLKAVQAIEVKTQFNQKVVDFTSLFIKKVLQANTAVDFNTRLSLENSVRDLNDPEIMTEWQNFTNSTTEADAQQNVKILLGTLISKIQN